MLQKTIILLLFTFMSFGLNMNFINLASAAEQSSALPDKPDQNPSRTVLVSIELEGSDSIGAKITFELKSLFNSSSLFELTEKDIPKIRVLLSTIPEFPSRPAVGSAYAVIWTFSQSEGTLRMLLAREVGVVDTAGVPELVSKIAERTDGLAVKYAYLFQ